MKLRYGDCNLSEHKFRPSVEEINNNKAGKPKFFFEVLNEV